MPAFGQINRSFRDMMGQFPGMVQDAMGKRKGFDVGYEDLNVPSYWQNLATEGYGQAGMRDMLYGQTQQIQGQYLQQRDQMRGTLGGRGLYDSSIRQRGEAGLLGQREGQIGQAEANIYKENQRIMMEGQKVLQDIRQFNAQNQFTADITNKQTNLQLYMQQRDLDMQQRMLKEQQRQGKWNMTAGLLGLATSFIPGL